MITFDIFLVGLMVISTLTSLVTEAVKKILTERETKYNANALAGIVAVILSAGVGAGYIILTGMSFTSQIVVCIIALMFMSWLCAMVGYDKVIDHLKQNKPKKD